MVVVKEKVGWVVAAGIQRRRGRGRAANRLRVALRGPWQDRAHEKCGRPHVRWAGRQIAGRPTALMVWMPCSSDSVYEPAMFWSLSPMPSRRSPRESIDSNMPSLMGV